MSGTRISYVHGAHQIGLSDRDGRNTLVRQPEYVPFTQLSKGQFLLAVKRNEARALADWSQDPIYTKAENMMTRALQGDTYNTGQIDPALYGVANLIKQSNRGANLYAVSGMKGAPRVGAEDLFKCHEYVVSQFLTNARSLVQAFYGANYEAKLSADALSGKLYQYKRPFPRQNQPAEISIVAQGFKNTCAGYDLIEKVYNDQLLGVQHHTVYNQLNPNHPILSSRVYTKALLHNGAREGLANFGLINQEAFRIWMDSLMVQKNLTTTDVNGPYNSLQTSFALNKGTNREALYNAYTLNPKKDKIGVVGITIAGVTALVTAIGAGIAAAAVMQKELNAKRQGAELGVKNYGTPSMSADPNDWDGDGIPNDQEPGSNGSGIDTDTMLLIGGGLAAAYFLTQD